MSLRLVYVDAAGRARRLTVTGEVVLGRGDEAGARLGPHNVSRRHARLTVDDGAVWIEDLGSRNGTRVNGAQVKARRRLRGGDVVALADELVQVEELAAGDTEDVVTHELELGAPGPRTPPPLPRPQPRTVEMPRPSRLQVAIAAAKRIIGG